MSFLRTFRSVVLKAVQVTIPAGRNHAVARPSLARPPKLVRSQTILDPWSSLVSANGNETPVVQAFRPTGRRIPVKLGVNRYEGRINGGVRDYVAPRGITTLTHHLARCQT